LQVAGGENDVGRRKGNGMELMKQGRRQAREKDWEMAQSIEKLLLTIFQLFASIVL
jgi:hypothetical protein